MSNAPAQALAQTLHALECALARALAHTALQTSTPLPIPQNKAWDSTKQRQPCADTHLLVGLLAEACAGKDTLASLFRGSG
eukprot:3932649-Pleurochrysis_carterae.AAC.1